MASARGRPRGFDRDLALERLMQVFWAKGYEGAQLNDLTAAIGVKPPSFYAAFGSKEAAFREAIDLYIATIGAAFWPKSVIVRLSDFKSNEYRKLVGGSRYEPEEENPMLGFRGASRSK